MVLSNIVNKILSKNTLIRYENFSIASYSKINFETFLNKFTQNTMFNNNLNEVKLDISIIKKELSFMKDYISLKINFYKFGKYLPTLKLLISKIYNKNIQLNIVKLKYLYLNSDIFMNVISLKLKKY